MNVSRLSLTLFFFQLSLFFLNAQTYDNCIDAFEIRDASNYCSDIAAFQNTGTSFFDANPICISDGPPVYFKFTAVATDIDITINGNSSSARGGTLASPEVGLYTISCRSNGESRDILECGQSSPGAGIVQIYQGGLIPGLTYFIVVKGLDNEVGSFRICTRNYYPPAIPGSDCSSASFLCDKSSFSVEQIIGAGNDRFELDGNNCFSSGSAAIGNETNSVWFKWTCDEPGSLTFSLTPSNPIDDLDFILFEMDDINDCSSKTLIRCMAAGNSPSLFPSVCHGATGLREGETDASEPAGCRQNQNNWLEPVQMQSGKSYALAINNYSGTGNGLSIDFGGTGTFLGPKPVIKFSAESLQCDREVEFSDSSYFANGTIINKEWTFGKAASIGEAEGDGPHVVNYEGFGDKDITLTLTSDRGCKTTLRRTLPILECCALDSDLSGRIVTVNDPSCHNSTDGSIFIEGLNGSVEDGYQYQILPNGDTSIRQSFTELPAGNFSFNVFDDKGCVITIDTFLNNPTKLELNLVSDKDDIALGDDVQIDLTYTPSDAVPAFTTIQQDTFLCGDTCLNRTYFPLEDDLYIATLVTDKGCVASDSLNIVVQKLRDVNFPNAIRLSAENNQNRFFSIYTSRPKAIKSVLKVQLFDRWGEHVREWSDISVNSMDADWNFVFRDQTLPSGTYVYYVEIEFIDGLIEKYKGDLSILH